MFPKGQKHHFIRTGIKQKQKANKTKTKLFLLLVKRACYARMKNYFHHILKVQQQEYNVLDVAFRRVERNIQFTKLIAWKKIFHHGQIRNKEKHIFKSALIISNRYQKSLIASSFKKITAYGRNKSIQQSRKLQKSKNYFMKFILNRLYKNVLTKSFYNIRLSAQQKLVRNLKHILLSKFLQKLFNKRINNSWTRIVGITNSQHKDLQHQLGELNNQLVSLRRQISRKDNQIIELLASQSQKKRQSVIFNSIGKRAYSNSSLQNSRKSVRSSGSRKDSSQDNSERRSNFQPECFQNNVNNVSILSWLNGSFMSMKSGKSSMKSFNGIDCNCKYREKYNKYRAQLSSLKNQMQIIKSELQVTKQLNQHLQQQISNLCGGQGESLQLQLLKKQVKDLKKEKQFLKDKILKSQKYIANLKYQFKLKIENLYRNLKKSNN